MTLKKSVIFEFENNNKLKCSVKRCLFIATHILRNDILDNEFKYTRLCIRHKNIITNKKEWKKQTNRRLEEWLKK